MAVFDLPTSTTLPFYNFEVELDGVTFKLEFKFNVRGDTWYMTILDPNDNILRAGLRVVNEYTILRLWQEATRPDGEIIAIPLGGQTTPATLEQLGEDVILTYNGDS